MAEILPTPGPLSRMRRTTFNVRIPNDVGVPGAREPNEQNPG
ncbi:hypothetical protein ACWEWI_28355 [Streptomyces sp. NPDC003753]|nr:hypothetical protein [Streptomyces sp. Y2F8-2]